MSSRRILFENAFAGLLFAAGFAILFRRWLFTGFDGVFGDEGDGEILIAIVEHWHHVFAGETHWTDPTFFYPERGVLGYTDALFLYGLVHAGLRGLGFDTFTSFMLVMAVLAALGFFGFIRLACRHFGIPIIWAALGAFLFAFGNMNAVKLVQAQAYCAMLLPLVCDLLLSAWSNPNRRWSIFLAAAGGLLHALIFFTAFQAAWFFTFFLALFALLSPLIFGAPRIRLFLHEAVTRKRHVLLGYGLAFAAGIPPFLIVYIPVFLSGRARDFAEVLSNAPDARDILNVTTANWLWGEALRLAHITGRPNRPVWEVELGFTPGLFALLAGATLTFAWRLGRTTPGLGDRERWLLLLGLGVFLCWLLQLDYAGIHPWKVIWAFVPGASAVRYTFRAQTAANLFAAIVVAGALARLEAVTRGRRGAVALLVAGVVLLLVEQVNTQWPATISRRAKMAWLDAIPPAPEGCKVFYLVPRAAPADKAGWEHQADAMLFSQIRGIPTINGYSSWLPDGWDLEEPAKPGYASAVRDWAMRNGIEAGLCGLDPAQGQWTIGPPR
jgi:hypothetical protein